MEQNQNSLTPEAATDEPVSPSIQNDEGFVFATIGEEDAYWAGVCDGMRNIGDKPVPPRLAARARHDYPELICTAEELRARPGDIIEFDPVSTRHRIDGWTPEKQREYVEALADSGVSRYAAARVGMSEQSVARLRRRADARSFDLACEAAIRIGARRIRAVAYERAIEGTVRRHYFHGELKSEERVYDNRLLVYLLGKVDHLLDPPEEAETIAENWQPFVEAMEQGLPPPALGEADTPEPEGDVSDQGEEAEEDSFAGDEVWDKPDGTWWTLFPPPEGFDGEEEGESGKYGYRRTLSPAEQAVIEADEAEERAQEIAYESARRDRYFGFEGGSVFSPREAELYEPSSQAAPE